MRSRAIHCSICIIAGLFVRSASASDSTIMTSFLGEQNLFSVFFSSWRVILALCILAGIINLLARSHNRAALGIEIPKQLSSQPVAFGLGLVAVLFVILSLTPLPTLPFLVLAELFVLLAWTSYQKTNIEDARNPSEIEQQKLPKPNSRDSIVRLELGGSLLTLASPEMNGNLVERMASLRATVLDDLGLKIPPIQIKDDLNLPSNTYRIYLRGGIMGEGVVYKDRFMVVEGEEDGENLEGIREQDPVFGLSAIWITEEVRDSVGELFVRAIDPVSVVMTHLSNIVDKHASEFLSREEVAVMVKNLHAISPSLVDEVIGTTLPLSRLHHILKSLLEEQVPVKDLATIIETASDMSDLSVEECVERVRTTLRRQICANVSTSGIGGEQIIRCVELPEEVEIALSNRHISKEEISVALQRAALPLIEDGLPIVVVTSTTFRRHVKAQVLSGNENVVVLSRSEIVPEVTLQIVGMVEPIEHLERVVPIPETEGDKQQTIAYAKSVLHHPKPSSTIEHRIELGIEEIRTLVGEFLNHESVGRLSPVLSNTHHLLMQQGIDASLASAIVQAIRVDASTDTEEIQQQLMQELLRRLPRAVPPPNRDSNSPTVIALVGPTGVGKTTTIAKLATKFRLQQGRTVALVTADTYRTAAVEQLQQYADIFESILEVAGTADQMKEAMVRCQSADIVLIDTAGRSAADVDRIQETANIVNVAQPDEIHLVLSAATSLSATQKAARGFGVTGYDRIIVSKLDEAESLGEMVSMLCEINKPMSWFTNGQDISTHIDLARPSKLIESLWGQERPITC